MKKVQVILNKRITSIGNNKLTENINIRRATKADFLSINKLANQIHDLHVANLPEIFKETEYPIPETYFIEKLNDEKIKFYVLTENEIVIAYAIVEIRNSKDLPLMHKQCLHLIDTFIVDSTKRKKGFGKFLFNQIVQDSKNDKADKIILDVWEFNKDAEKFYISLGMKNRLKRMEYDLT